MTLSNCGAALSTVLVTCRSAVGMCVLTDDVLSAGFRSGPLAPSSLIVAVLLTESVLGGSAVLSLTAKVTVPDAPTARLPISSVPEVPAGSPSLKDHPAELPAATNV